MSDDIKELGERIVEVIRARTGAFLDDNSDAKDFILERSKRLAKLLLKMARAGEDEVPAIKADIAIVRQTIETEFATVAVHASVDARATFLSIVAVVFDFAQKALPTLLALI